MSAWTIIILKNDKCHTKLLDHPCSVDDPQKLNKLTEKERKREREREGGGENSERDFKLALKENQTKINNTSSYFELQQQQHDVLDI